MKLYTYLNYGGNCRQAFEFYEAHLGGKITSVTTHGEQDDSSEVPPDWKNAVLHARIEIGDTMLLGADIPPVRFQPMRSAYLSLMVDSVDEAERIYALLSEGGQIFMPMVRRSAFRIPPGLFEYPITWPPSPCRRFSRPPW